VEWLCKDCHSEAGRIKDGITVLSVDGLVCDMCDAHMNDAIRKVFKVKKVTTSHANGELLSLCYQC
jgi:hypothetical protein